MRNGSMPFFSYEPSRVAAVLRLFKFKMTPLKSAAFETRFSDSRHESKGNFGDFASRSEEDEQKCHLSRSCPL